MVHPLPGNIRKNNGGAFIMLLLLYTLCTIFTKNPGYVILKQIYVLIFITSTLSSYSMEKIMDLFEYAKSKTLDQESPLASRLRPTTLDEVVGQQHIIGKNTLLYRAIKADKLTSVIFYGPPGTGKTTLWPKSLPTPQAQNLPRSTPP